MREEEQVAERQEAQKAMEDQQGAGGARTPQRRRPERHVAGEGRQPQQRPGRGGAEAAGAQAAHGGARGVEPRQRQHRAVQRRQEPQAQEAHHSLARQGALGGLLGHNAERREEEQRVEEPNPPHAWPEDLEDLEEL